MNPTVVSEIPISMSELKEGIAKIKKRDSEPGFRVKKTEEYLQSFDILGQKEAQELFDKLMGLNVPRLKDSHVNKLIDLLPTDVNDLKLILQGYTISVSNENLKKVVDVIKEYAE